MHMPVLDLYGAEDYPAVIRLAPARKEMIDKTGHEKSRQMVLPGADHYFTDQGDPLVDAVADWLDQLE
jgi:alpha/beta superfamily hydrolase